MNIEKEFMIAAAEAADPEPVKPVIVLEASRDQMELTLTLQQMGEPVLPVTYEEIAESIAREGVVYGIDDAAVRGIATAPVYQKPVVVAKGTPPETGRDGELHYLIRTSKDMRPKIREDGTADYRDLGYVQNVRKGDVLCEIIPPEQGPDGKDIYGNVREGLRGRQPLSPEGRNTEYNEDRSFLVASCDGNADVFQGVITVTDVMRIDGNVDNSTGDVHFVGDVYISGDVLSGFRVESEGSVVVLGSVEGAVIQANGDITVSEGVNGMSKGMLLAGGNIKCRYIQSCFVKVMGDVFADTIMYCNLECGGNVELSGKRATLIGGRSTISGKLVAKRIGTNSHIPTPVIMASSGMQKNQEIINLEQEIAQVDQDLEKLSQISARLDELNQKGLVDEKQAKTILVVKNNYIIQTRNRKKLVDRLEQTRQEQMEASRERSFIECTGRIHVGVQLVFGPLVMNVQESFVYSRVRVIGNNIAVTPL